MYSIEREGLKIVRYFGIWYASILGISSYSVCCFFFWEQKQRSIEKRGAGEVEKGGDVDHVYRR